MSMPLRSATVQPPWSTLTARLGLADGTVTLADLDGTLAGVGIKGELGIGMAAEPMRLNGDITVAALDLPAAIGAAIGFPRQSGNKMATAASGRPTRSKADSWAP